MALRMSPMVLHLRRLLLLVISTAPLVSPTPCTTLNPWALSGVVLGDVGSSANPSQYCCKGGTGAVVLGSMWCDLQNVDRNPDPVTLFVGGDLHDVFDSVTPGGDLHIHGNLEVQGNFYSLSPQKVDGYLKVGGNLSGTAQLFNGTVSVAGQCTWSGCPLPNTPVPFAPNVDVTGLKSYFECLSIQLGQNALTGTYATSGGGATLIITAPLAGRNYVTIPAATLIAATSITVTQGGTTGAMDLVVNVQQSGEIVGFRFALSSDSYTNNLVNAGKLLINLPNATKVTNPATHITPPILAPFATLSGVLITYSNLIMQRVDVLSQFVVLGTTSTLCSMTFPTVCNIQGCGVICDAQQSAIPQSYATRVLNGCSAANIATALAPYNCTELQPECGTVVCQTSVPQEALDQLSGCTQIAL